MGGREIFWGHGDSSHRFKALEEEESLEKMKEESRGLPRLRLDMLRQLRCALLEGFNRHDKTGNRCTLFILYHCLNNYIFTYKI